MPGCSGKSVAVGAHASETPRADRVAIVTGGSRGIGRKVARRLAALGYAVVVNYAANQGDGDAAVAEILAADGTAIAVRADVTDELDVERLFAETIEAFGAVDVIVHAAVLGPVTDVELDAVDALQRTNERGTYVVNRQAARQLRDGGAIVNLSGSIVGLTVPDHAASAAGTLETLTRVLARELHEREITVNAIAAGPTHRGSCAEIAKFVAFLVSADGHGVTGEVIGPPAPSPD
jgi:3-oxoacyl-[acyl-carrier protein] reductase